MVLINRVLEPHSIGTVRDTVFRRHLCEWVLPQEVATKVNYNTRHVPCVIYDVYWFADIRGTYVHIWERTRMFDFDYNRRVHASYKGNPYPISIGEASQCSGSLLPSPTYPSKSP